MDLLLLRTFLKVCETGSFSAAASELACVQSNVTARIRRLEERFEQPLFHRGRGGATLTEFGGRLKTHAQDLVARFEAAESDLLDLAGASAPLTIGAMETTAATRLPPLLKKLNQQFPKAKITLRTGPSGELATLLFDRKLDAAFIAGPIDHDRFRGVPAFSETLTMAEGGDAPNANSLLAFRSGCSFRAQTENWLRDTGKPDTQVLEMGSLEGILGCVEAGMGFAVAPESAVLNYRNIHALKLTRLPEPYSVMEINLVWRHDHRKTKALQSLCDIVSQNCGAL